jgi:hypothetical protein
MLLKVLINETIEADESKNHFCFYPFSFFFLQKVDLPPWLSMGMPGNPAEKRLKGKISENEK